MSGQRRREEKWSEGEEREGGGGASGGGRGGRGGEGSREGEGQNREHMATVVCILVVTLSFKTHDCHL